MNGYLLTIAVLVVTAGRIGDMFGRRRVFVVGLLTFAAGSVLSGCRADPEMLIGGRVLQGVGGGADADPVAGDRLQGLREGRAAPGARASGPAVSAVALAVGPLVGGALIDARLAADLLDQPADRRARRGVDLAAAPESTDPEAGTRIDVPGLIALTLGLTAAVLAMIQVEAWAGTARWSSAGGRRRRPDRLLVDRAPGREPIVEF